MKRSNGFLIFKSAAMKILTLNPPFLPKFSRESRSPAVSKSGTLYYPMWLAYATGYLEKAGHEVLLLDASATGLSLEQTVERAKAHQPALAILDTSTPSIYNDIAVGKALKSALPSLFVVLVGVHVSALPTETLESDPGIDAVAFGEYDATLRELAAALSQKGRSDESLGHIAGLAFRSSKGTVVKNAVRPFIENLDDIPPVSEVYKKHLDIRPYFYGHSRYPLIVLVTGRGCPFHCTYCVIPQTLMGHRYRKRSNGAIVEEFRYIAERFSGIREIMIEDDTLTADRNRCRELSEALIAAGACRIPWSANSRADIDYNTLRIMKKAGCRLLCVGFESGDQRILDNIKKSITLEKIRQFVKDARRAGILVHGCFMVGNRGETRETLAATLAFAKELNPDTAQFFPIMVYPGTEDYRFFGEKGWIVSGDFRKWLTEEGLHSSVVSLPDITYEELVAFCDNARREFYLRPRYIFAKGVQAFSHPGEIRRLIKGAANLFRYLFAPSIRK
ncbi:MAG: cobalamin-dependent protein [Chitinispirillaceae bacterium]|nr:cobalamin-dependent protein [Chitinispirillaceae bacterium]